MAKTTSLINVDKKFEERIKNIWPRLQNPERTRKVLDFLDGEIPSMKRKLKTELTDSPNDVKIKKFARRGMGL